MTERTWAADLLNQQIWCWGQDAIRPDGNWLTEIGFQRNPPPPEREECSSVYTLPADGGRRITLRGFGAFIADDALGQLFLPRFGFAPEYSESTNFTRPPWSPADLPRFGPPPTDRLEECGTLLLGLVAWIVDYETAVLTRLGAEYRRQTLTTWEAGGNRITPPDEIAPAWRRLSQLVAADAGAWLEQPPTTVAVREEAPRSDPKRFSPAATLRPRL
ncbi:MAG: hypothetical protein AAF907_01665 [Planctomycetota bacterium]